jgi:CheY-like chemotaxis protein
MESRLRGRAERARRVLVVDDNEDMLESTKILLERAGYDVEVASNGERAMILQRERPADVLITDIFMPDKDGVELISHFRQEFPAVRIIAMSGGGVRTKRDYLADASLLGVDATLRKPFEPEALLQTLRRLLFA